MIRAIDKIKALEALSKLGQVSQFNATLPTSISVLKDLSSTSLSDPFRYLLKLGNKTLETKSQTPLEVGANYWGKLSESKEGSILLSKLTKKPSLLQLPPDVLKALPALPLEGVELLFKEKKPTQKLKEFLLHALAQAPDKQTFVYLSSMVLGFMNDVATLVIEDHQKRKGMVQYKTKKREERGLTHFVIEFYSAMPNLGPISGHIIDENGAMRLTLCTEFENSAQFLSQELKNLSSFQEVVVKHTVGVKELYTLSDRLLNLQA